MPIKIETVAAIAVFAIAHELLIERPLRKRFATLARIAIATDKENEMLKEKLKYMFHVINENNVELDDFDWIALLHDVPTP